MANTAEAHHDDHDHHMPGFFTRWFCSTNHKDIGTLYILVSFIAAVIGGAMSWYIRLELAAPGIQYIDDFQFYNVLVTAHGFLMVFFVIDKVSQRRQEENEVQYKNEATEETNTIKERT